MGEAAAFRRYGATAAGTGSTSCEYFYHPDERAASGGLTRLLSAPTLLPAPQNLPPPGMCDSLK